MKFRKMVLPDLRFRNYLNSKPSQQKLVKNLYQILFIHLFNPKQSSQLINEHEELKQASAFRSHTVAVLLGGDGNTAFYI